RDDVELKGCINLSPAWFQQGRNGQGRNHLPEVLASLKKSNGDSGGRVWVGAMVILNTLLSVMLAVMHPDLYAAGREAMIKLGDHAERVDAEMGEMLERWSSVYGVISVMVNRESPLHRDYNGKNEWMDLSASVGQY
ncbi:hypothetical protein PAXRUDRAFT_159879, partial [Paxillus rubicundulus Ve08.2h10]